VAIPKSAATTVEATRANGDPTGEPDAVGPAGDGVADDWNRPTRP
jgi:hypothetical protein